MDCHGGVAHVLLMAEDEVYINSGTHGFNRVRGLGTIQNYSVDDIPLLSY